MEAEGGIEPPSTALQAAKYTYNSIMYRHCHSYRHLCMANYEFVP